MTLSTEALCEKFLGIAAQAGAKSADVMIYRSVSNMVEVRNGALEQAERSENTEIGLRVLIDGKQACVSASDSSENTMQKMAERAVAMANLAPADPHLRQAEPGEFAKEWDIAALDLVDNSPEPDAATLQSRAQAAEDAAMAVQGITQTQHCSASYGESDVYLATSNGFAGGYQTTGHSLSCLAIAGTGTGMERDHDGDFRLHAADLRSPEEIGNKAATLALAKLAPRKPPTGSFPVIYDERVAAGLIGHLQAACNGASVARGSSWLRHRMGQQVLPRGIDLVENPHHARKTSSRPFDGEGLATQSRAIVQDGVLMGWHVDLANAGKLDVAPTASAARSPGSPPSPTLSNVDMTQGSITRDELLTQMGTGFLVTSLIGSTINPTTGDYSRGASGFWVENGEIQYPVSECTIAGNLHDMLANIVPANDARMYLSRPVPSLLVPGMTVAGA